MPFLQLFFSINGSIYVIAVFIVDEPFTIIFCRETFRVNGFSMFRYSLYEVRGYSNIESSVFTICHYVNVSGVHILGKVEMLK